MKNILIVGVGGQGTLLASKIMGQVGVLANLDVKQSEVHGMAQRGGSVVTYVRIGEKVYSPLIEKGDADLILAFEKLEGLRWAEYLKPGGTLIVNDQEISPMPVILGAAQYPDKIYEKLNQANIQTLKIDALKLAESLGETRAVNVILLGVAAKLLGFPQKVWEEALQDTVPAKSLAINKKAFALGWEM
ncbi:MAG: indolepyruvate oxidoreductase subunit beta [Sporomusaceae bacterium]|nr:indolepyruvate oxidoreductase subunit beta [Sporomusaceae bacterium]